MKRASLISTAVAVLLLAQAAPANAESILFSGSATFIDGDGTHNLAASALFELINVPVDGTYPDGLQLRVTLSNTSAFDTLFRSEILLGVFFDVTSTLTPVSAALNAGSHTFISTPSYPTQDDSVDLGEGWRYQAGINQYGHDTAIRAAGYGLPGGGDGNFSPTGVDLDGDDYGLLSQGDNINTNTSNFANSAPLVKSSIVFLLSATNGFSLSQLGNKVTFQYGTSLDQPHFDGEFVIPEPSSLALLSLGMVGVAGVGRLRKKTKVATAA